METALQIEKNGFVFKADDAPNGDDFFDPDPPKYKVEGGHDGGELPGGVLGGESDGQDDNVQEHEHDIDPDGDNY